jgi:hypothetical protein
MSLWVFLLIIFGAGTIGGIVNALMSDNAFILPKAEITKENYRIYRPGIIGNIVISGVASCISWGLYGPFGTAYIAGGQTAQPGIAVQPGVTLAAFVGAILVGIAGARWITNEVDKNLLRATAAEAASLKASNQLAAKIAMAKPAEALRLAQSSKEQ